MNKKLFLVMLHLSFLSNLSVAKEIYPAEIVGRDLDYNKLGWLGHVGVTTASYIGQNADMVIEAMNEPLVIQLNTIKNFKTRSPYWGSRYGISDRGQRGTRIINEAAFQASLKCAEYTITNAYRIGKGAWGVPTSCGMFRCDTFVNYLFHWGGYNLPTYSPIGEYANTTLPRLVFNAFPYANDNKLSGSQIINQTLPLSVTTHLATIELLEKMSFEEFIKAVDLPENQLSKADVGNILKFAQTEILTTDKRLFLLDKLGFVGTVDMIPSLIDLYYKNQESESFSHMIMRDIQAIYQNNFTDNQYVEEKQRLLKFYVDILGKNLSDIDIPIVIRGLTTLGTTEVILANQDKLNKLFGTKINKLDSGVNLVLQIGLALKSPELEKIYIPSILSLLSYENKADLDIVFSGAVVSRLGKLNINSLGQESKDLIKGYLLSKSYKYDPYGSNQEAIVMPGFGIFLEASALINSDSLPEAGRYIAKFLCAKDLAEQKIYIAGLSNNSYMKQAFKIEPILIEFKKKNEIFYLNTVGMPMKK